MSNERDQALALGRRGDPKTAISILNRLVANGDSSTETREALALCLAWSGETTAAETEFRTALAAPDPTPSLLINWGIFLLGQGRVTEAAPVWRDVCEQQPENGYAWNCLGYALIESNALVEAESVLRRAAALSTDDPGIAVNLARTRCLLGNADAALAGLDHEPWQRRAPWMVAQAALWPALYSDQTTTEKLKERHQRIGAMAGPNRQRQFPNDRNPNRKLRIAFVSPDFGRHAVTSFVEGWLPFLDRNAFQVTLLCNRESEDDVSARLKSVADHWRNAALLSSREFSELVTSLKIDMLVDLAGHTLGNRLPEMANRLAPVQVTWIGYPATTGVPSLDYRLVDALTDPEESFATEELIRLPGCFLCWQPPAFEVEPKKLTGRPLTFGSFNDSAKLSPTTLRLWTQIQLLHPNSHFLVKNRTLSDPATQDHFRERWRAAGGDVARLRLLGHSESAESHLATYREIDIALDPFPYHGTTTTVEALWMGTPVVSLVGEMHHSRVGLSLLTTFGNPNWAANTEAEYLSKVDQLAKSRPEPLAIRQKLLDSPLCDGESFAETLSDVFRSLWTRWVEASSGR